MEESAAATSAPTTAPLLRQLMADLANRPRLPISRAPASDAVTRRSGSDTRGRGTRMDGRRVRVQFAVLGNAGARRRRDAARGTGRRIATGGVYNRAGRAGQAACSSRTAPTATAGPQGRRGPALVGRRGSSRTGRRGPSGGSSRRSRSRCRLVTGISVSPTRTTSRSDRPDILQVERLPAAPGRQSPVGQHARRAGAAVADAGDKGSRASQLRDGAGRSVASGRVPDRQWRLTKSTRPR